MLDKIRAVEAMVNNAIRRKAAGRQKINFAVKRAAPASADSPDSKVSRSQSSSGSDQTWRVQTEAEILKEALEQLRLEAERLELDKHILGKQAARRKDADRKCS